MKTKRGKIIRKTSVSSKVNKKKHGYNTKRTWGLGSNVTLEKLDNLNEVIREHKTHRAEVNSWKLVPKDSCEVYKERRKRKMENDRRIEDDERDNETYTRTGRRIVRRNQRNRKNKRKYTRPYIKRRTNRRRVQPSESSIASGDCDCGCNCESPSSSASSARSSPTISDMEYYY